MALKPPIKVIWENEPDPKLVMQAFMPVLISRFRKIISDPELLAQVLGEKEPKEKISK